MNPERDPAIAEGNDSSGERDHPAEQPGTELAARREMLPAELVAPTRAGAIVAEFVNSIVEEAQARALEMIRAAANEDDAGQREALERADRMRARIDLMAEELEDAVGQLRQESDRLASLREESTFVALTGASPEPDTGERQALAQVAAGLERAEAEPEQPSAEEPDEGDEDPVHEVEVVSTHHDDEDEPEASEEGEDDDATGEAAVEGHAEEDLGEEPPAAVTEEPAVAEPPAAEEPAAAADTEVEPGPEERLGHEEAVLAGQPPIDEPAFEGTAATGSEEAEAGAAGLEEGEEPKSEEEELAEDQERFARMNDAELAAAYSNALDQMDVQPAESERGARLLRYAGSALGEALTRPSFADIGQGAPALETVPRMGRKRRRRAESINTLRRACTQAIEEMSAAEEALR